MPVFITFCVVPARADIVGVVFAAVVATGRALRADIVRVPPVALVVGVALRALRALRAAVDGVVVVVLADVERVLVRRAGAASTELNIKNVANNDSKMRIFIFVGSFPI